MKMINRYVLAASALTLASPALAHPGHEGGLMSGLLHPVTGFDHLAAMVAVGLWSATRGQGRSWQGPLAFMVALLAGAVAGMVGGPSSLVELGTLATLTLFAAMLFAGPRISERVGLALIAGAGLLHGYAHGAEAGGDVAGFVAGFLAASALLHLAGLGLGARLMKLRNGMAAAAILLLAGAVTLSIA